MLPVSKVLLLQPERQAHLPLPRRARRDSQGGPGPLRPFIVPQAPFPASFPVFVGPLDLVVFLFRFPFL